MSNRDYRTHKSIFQSEKNANGLTGSIAGLYEIISHKKILSHADKKEKLEAKIISLGNITFGGSGKTPHAEFLAHYLSEQKKSPGIVAGGWGGDRRNDGILVSDGVKILADYKSAGDEAISLSKNVLDCDVPLYAHRNRILGAKELINQFNCDIIIFDDAFHFVSIHKDADILLIDATSPFGAGPLPNRGIMREPFQAITRADSIILTHTDQVDETEIRQIEKLAHDTEFDNPIFKSSFIPDYIECSDGTELTIDDARNFKLVPLSGLGNPQSFEKSLADIGIVNPNPIRFNDHHTYTQPDIEKINTAVKDDSADGIITTLKDWIRLENHADKIRSKIYILHSRIEIENDFLSWLITRV